MNTRESLEAELTLARECLEQANSNTLYWRERCEKLMAQNEEFRSSLTAAYKIAVDHDDNLPFDWAVYCEMLYQAINKE